MEKVWEELKKIEAQAEQIRSEAKEKSKQITTFAEQNAEKLIANSKTYAHEEAQQINTGVLEEASRNHTQRLKENQEAIEKLKQTAEKRMETAATAIRDTVLGETKVAAANQIR
jgi:vacuolar-type H+-ATPase subunit H